MTARRRLAIVASHPVQYNAPWFRALAAEVDLQVLFAHRVTPADQVRAGFGVAFDWDVPLLDGYRSDWLRNVARRPGVDHFWGCNTPDVAARLSPSRVDALLVTGWNLWSYWQAVRAARRAGVPVMVRGDSQLVTRRGAVKRMAKRVVYPRVLEAFDACLTVGRRNHEYYRYYSVPSERLYRAPHSVENQFFARTADVARRAVPDARDSLGVPRDAVVFVFAGRLTDLKRPLDFMSALDHVRRLQAPVWGLIVGDGALRGAVEEHKRRNGTPCTITGFMNQQQIATAYAAADAIVLPSSAGETWGLVVNEAMACGLPAIVSDEAGCAPDLVVEGRTGFTYPCGNVAALTARMIRLAGDGALRREMAGQSVVHIESYSPQATAAGVLAALEHVRPRAATAA